MTRHAETLLIEGADAAAFAQAQFGSHVAALEAGQWQFSAWLNAQGRVRFLFHLARTADDSYLILLRGGTAASMAHALARFVFRLKLTISAQPLLNLSLGPALPLYSMRHLDAGTAVGCGTHSLMVSSERAGDDIWQLEQLRLGWPWLSDAALDQLLPSHLSLQRLGAVAVDKGCYPGQEIVARMHFRGGNKRHLCSGVLSQACAVDDVLRHEGTEAARVIDINSRDERIEVLVILHDEMVARASENVIVFDDQHVSMHVETVWPV